MLSIKSSVSCHRLGVGLGVSPWEYGGCELCVQWQRTVPQPLVTQPHQKLHLALSAVLGGEGWREVQQSNPSSRLHKDGGRKCLETGSRRSVWKCSHWWHTCAIGALWRTRTACISSTTRENGANLATRKQVSTGNCTWSDYLRIKTDEQPWMQTVYMKVTHLSLTTCNHSLCDCIQTTVDRISLSLICTNSLCSADRKHMTIPTAEIC